MKSANSPQGPWLPTVLWLTVTLSERCHASSAEALVRRLNRYLSDAGLSALMFGERLGLVAVRNPLTPLDLAMTITWLVSQPEVVMVRPVRPESRSSRCGGMGHG